jgi:predicted NBD/HSP70 family sugar kinase
MQHLGIPVEIKNVPVYDTQFIPIGKFNAAFRARAQKPVSVCAERDNGLTAVYDTFVTGDNREADRCYIERTVKLLLWLKGGFKVAVCGDDELAAHIKETYSPGGKRAFDAEFMAKVYERPFEVVSLPPAEKPVEKEQSKPIGGSLRGCRIGFDAGGSDRKVSAVVDGEAVYSEEVVWHPKTEPDPGYHYREIVSAFRTAASKMPKVDSIGVSSAGIYIANRTAAASLFLKVPQDAFDREVRDIYIRAAKEIGDVPLAVVNDGDVTALAGAMELEDSSVLGIAMGTSQAGGFVDQNGNITGWLNELAFAPVDLCGNAMTDEWSGDRGCGVKYFSQDGVIRLAGNAGIRLDPAMTPGEKLKAVQDLMEQGDPRVPDIFRSIGCCLGHTLPYYHEFYHFRHVLLLGRVMSGEGGNLIFETAKKVLSDEYPNASFNLHVPDEKSRRVGQSIAAASL